MANLRGVGELLRSLLRRRAMDEEAAEEMRFHVEEETAANMRRGMGRAEAERRARLEFGGEDRFMEETRDARGTRWLEDLVRDVVWSVRVMRRSPGPSFVAVLTIALGIGAATAVFSVVKAVLLDPLPFPDSDRLVSVYGRFLPESGFDFPQFPLSAPEYFDYRENNRSMVDVAAMGTLGVTLQPEGGEAERVIGGTVTANLFDVVGVSPLLGRGFTAEEDVPDGPGVVMISHGLWQRAYGGDAGIIGRMIRLNGFNVEVVGVMPAGFSFPGRDLALWVPQGLNQAANQRSSHSLSAVARLRPGVTFEEAQAEMVVMMSAWEAEYPEIHTGHFLFLRSLKDDVVGDVKLALLVLMSAVGVIVLIVCANVANMQLARATTRQREVAVRAALGGSRRRLVGQFLTESALLALAGGASGVVLARFGVSAILAAAAGSIPRSDSVDADPVVALFALAVTFVTALASGALPALRAAGASPQSAMREGDRSATHGKSRTRVRSGLVVVEVALAVVIVVAAGLMVRSFRALVSVDAGFDPRGVLTASVSLPSGTYPDLAGVQSFHERVVERLKALPGVQSASATSALPLDGGSNGVWDFMVEGRPDPAPGQPAFNGEVIVMMPGLAETLGMRVIEGRFFDATDREGSARVTVVNRKLASTFFPGESAVGRRIRVEALDDAPWLTIVGVLDDFRNLTLDSEQLAGWYTPFAQATNSIDFLPRRLSYVIRTSGDPAQLASAVRSAIQAEDSALPVTALGTMASVVSDSLAGQRFTLRLLGVFATLALLLGAIGLYGTLSCAVAERTRELGIRRALGATDREILGVVADQGLRLTTLGLAAGMLVALAGTRLLQGLLFGVQPTDPATLVLVAITMLVAAAIAAVVPSMRAVRLNPLEILRDG